jgi:fatty acid-binding protein DegV
VIEKILNALVELKREKGIAQLAIVHGNVPEEAKEIAARITETTGVTPDYVDQITPVLGAHGGPGAFDIAVMTER